MAGAVETGTAEVNGTRLYYETCGDGPVLLFLHGFTLDHRMWNRQVEALRDSYRIVTFDARGAGRSAMPGTAKFMHCEDAAALCEHLGLTRVIAIGHSIGAHYALELALSRPELISGLGLICTSGLAGIPFPAEVVETFVAVRKTASSEGIAAAKPIWARSGWFASARETPSLKSEIDQMFADYSGWHWTHDNPATNIDPPAAERLGAVSVPTLVVTGGRDLPYNEVVGKALLAGIPRAVGLHLPNAGHMAGMEDPDAVTRALRELAQRAGQ